jgi:N-succinyldiaminopimelate aminotransferase
VDPLTQVLPVGGSREALFAFAQTVIDPTRAGATVVCPNPFYQIYEGAALLAGAQTCFVPCLPERNFAADWAAVDEATWARTQLVYVCSPGNPTGAVMPLDEWQALFDLSDRHGFVIASDECYSEIYFRDEAPLGGLQAALALGRSDFRNLMAFTSLSKRSNVPGMRSGFVAGDSRWIKPFLLYRTYHGSAMGPMVQRASAVAWSDEAHVVANRALYRAKFAQVLPLLAPVLDVQLPDAAFYLWAGVRTPGGGTADEVAWARGLLAQYNVNVLPGSLLARSVQGPDPSCPPSTPAPAASGWRWWHLWTNAWKLPSASSPTARTLHEHPSAAIRHRPGLGVPRRDLRHQRTRGARGGRARDRRAERRPPARGRAPGRGRLDRSTSG